MRWAGSQDYVFGSQDYVFGKSGLCVGQSGLCVWKSGLCVWKVRIVCVGTHVLPPVPEHDMLWLLCDVVRYSFGWGGMEWWLQVRVRCLESQDCALGSQDYAVVSVPHPTPQISECCEPIHLILIGSPDWSVGKSGLEYWQVRMGYWQVRMVLEC